MPKNLLLTGPIRTGKSTLLKSVTQPVRPFTGGYFTQRLLIQGKTRAFRLVDLAREQYLPDRHVTSLTGFTDLFVVINRKRHYHTQVFETTGVLALERARCEKRLVLMDELGRVETKAPVFIQAVFTVLDSSTPVLGVIKNERNFFLDQIRARADVRVIHLQHCTIARTRREIQAFLSTILKE